jgi:hypothetical protein
VLVSRRLGASGALPRGDRHGGRIGLGRVLWGGKAAGEVAGRASAEEPRRS